MCRLTHKYLDACQPVKSITIFSLSYVKVNSNSEGLVATVNEGCVTMAIPGPVQTSYAGNTRWEKLSLIHIYIHRTDKLVPFTASPTQ